MVLNRSVIEARRIFEQHEKFRLQMVVQADRDGFEGVEIYFGLRYGRVTFQYVLVEAGERKAAYPQTEL